MAPTPRMRAMKYYLVVASMRVNGGLDLGLEGLLRRRRIGKLRLVKVWRLGGESEAESLQQERLRKDSSTSK